MTFCADILSGPVLFCEWAKPHSDRQTQDELNDGVEDDQQLLGLVVLLELLQELQFLLGLIPASIYVREPSQIQRKVQVPSFVWREEEWGENTTLRDASAVYKVSTKTLKLFQSCFREAYF